MDEIRSVKKNEIDNALSLLLEDDRSDSEQLAKKIDDFKTMALKDKLDLTRQVVVVREGQIIFSCLVAPQPGRIGFVFVASPPSYSPGAANSAQQALNKLCDMEPAQQCRLLQVIIDHDDLARRTLCQNSGWSYLTDLLYLYFIVDSPNPATCDCHSRQWTAYQKEDHDCFKDIIHKTYQNSLDCPELESLRDMEDVIQGHRAVGKFDPENWQLLWDDGQPVGVLLMASHLQSRAMELVYMGIIPAARKQHLGALLLDRACVLAMKNQAEHILLAVDRRNFPAYQLYKHFGFKFLLKKAILIKSLAKNQLK